MVYFRIRHTFDGKLFHVSRFRIRSGFVSDKLCRYFVRKIQILQFKFIFPVLFKIIFRILNFILNKEKYRRILKQEMVCFRIRHTFDGKLFHGSGFTVQDSTQTNCVGISFDTQIVCGSWFMISLLIMINFGILNFNFNLSTRNASPSVAGYDRYTYFWNIYFCGSGYEWIKRKSTKIYKILVFLLMILENKFKKAN